MPGIPVAWKAVGVFFLGNTEEDDAALADNFGSKMQAITFRDYELKVCVENDGLIVGNPPKMVLIQFGGDSVQDLLHVMLIWQERLSHLSTKIRKLITSHPMIKTLKLCRFCVFFSAFFRAESELKMTPFWGSPFFLEICIEVGWITSLRHHLTGLVWWKAKE